MLAEEYAERFHVELMAMKQGEWDVFSGVYEVGKAIWIDDGYILLQGPIVSPRDRKQYANQKGLKSIYRRITFLEQPDGFVVTLLPANKTGEHTKFGWLECKLFKLPDDVHAEYDALFEREMGPGPCAQATACCQAIKSTGRGAENEDTADVCNANPDLTPRYCRNWMKSAVQEFRWSTNSECVTDRNGQRLCSLGGVRKEARVAPEACVKPEKPAKVKP